MTKIFLDTNVVLDFILKREGFAEDAAIIFDMGERNYVVSKIESKKKSRRIIIKLLSLVEVLSVSESTIKKAAMSEFKDFEDAIQNFCAEEEGLNHIITRDLKDYKKSKLSVLSPKEFLTSLTLNTKK